MRKVRLFFSGREAPTQVYFGLIDGEKVTKLPYRRGKPIDLDDVENAISLMSNVMDIDSVLIEKVED